MLEFKFSAYDTANNKMIAWDKLKEMPLFLENPEFKISQSIGYPDKDGNELYTNDIVEWKGYSILNEGNMFRHICVVVNDKKEFCGWVLLSLEHINSGYIPIGKFGAMSSELTKLGNIFINPELLTNY